MARYAEAPLAVWIDVDLADVAEILPRLSPSSILFTHECQAENFIDGEILATPSSNDVLIPVVSAFESLDREPVGCFLAGAMGAIWDRDRGIPPRGIEAILTLCNAI